MTPPAEPEDWARIRHARPNAARQFSDTVLLHIRRTERATTTRKRCSAKLEEQFERLPLASNITTCQLVQWTDTQNPISGAWSSAYPTHKTVQSRSSIWYQPEKSGLSDQTSYRWQHAPLRHNSRYMYLSFCKHINLTIFQHRLLRRVLEVPGFLDQSKACGCLQG